jgi:hypothetical protein
VCSAEDERRRFAQRLLRGHVRDDLFEEADAAGSQGVVRGGWHGVLSIVA